MREVGDYLGEALADLQAARPNVVLEVRGRGLMRGVVINGSASAVREAAHNESLLIATAGDDVLRLVPPLILTRAQVDEAVEKLTRALDAAS